MLYCPDIYENKLLNNETLVNKNNVKLWTENEYKCLIRKALTKTFRQFAKLLKDDDAVSYIIYNTVIAHLRYDENNKFSKLEHYLFYCIKCACLDWCKRGKTKYNILPIDNTIYINKKEYSEEEFNRTLENSNLTSREKDFVSMKILNDASLQDIGNIYNLSRERVRQIYEASLLKIKKYVISRR